MAVIKILVLQIFNYPITKLPNYQITRLLNYSITRLLDSEMLRILYIAYPLLSVSDASAGGAEQVLWTLEQEMARRGIETSVAASAGSRVAGELFVTGDPCAVMDDFERRNREHQERIVEFVHQREQQGHGFDLVHDMSGSFWPRAALINAPVLATLHLPRSFYAPALFENLPANVSFNCVSRSQAQSFSDLPNFLGVARNGIALERFRTQPEQDIKGEPEQRQGLLWLGRICEEKAPHLALEIAERAGMGITIAGQVYPFSYHQRYFEQEVAPRLQQAPGAVLISSLSAQRKRELLRAAKALLITSQVNETSSLVAMEAAASGTPVIAFRRGALPDVVQDGVTGFVIESMEEAVEACGRVEEIWNGACAEHAQKNFSSTRMAEDYVNLYSRTIAANKASAA
jgi:glycosyltransferase involved in cell wall biosynthesis